MRLLEGIKADLTDSEFSAMFLQSRLTILNINKCDIEGSDVESFRKLFFFSLCFMQNRALDTGELFLN
jgi:hypothetical protein